MWTSLSPHAIRRRQELQYYTEASGERGTAVQDHTLTGMFYDWPDRLLVSLSQYHRNNINIYSYSTSEYRYHIYVLLILILLYEERSIKQYYS